MEEWFFTKGEDQQGPVTSEQIQALVTGGYLDPATTHVWREGMSDWKLLKETELLAAASQPPQLPQPVRQSYEVQAQYPGFGRLAYFVINLVMSIAAYVIFFFVLFAAMGIGKGGLSEALGIFVVFVLLMMIVHLVIAYKRLINVGMSGWMLLLAFVPFVNLWLGWRLIACPPGYEYHRTLDTAGKVITGIILGFFALSILGAIAPVFFAV